jgi:hypothetical protein
MDPGHAAFGAFIILVCPFDFKTFPAIFLFDEFRLALCVPVNIVTKIYSLQADCFAFLRAGRLIGKQIAKGDVVAANCSGVSLAETLRK